MNGVQLPQGYELQGRGTTRRQFTFHYLVLRNSWYSFDRSRKETYLYLLQDDLTKTFKSILYVQQVCIK